jgi:hypothetical protein
MVKLPTGKSDTERRRFRPERFHRRRNVSDETGVEVSGYGSVIVPRQPGYEATTIQVGRRRRLSTKQGGGPLITTELFGESYQQDHHGAGRSHRP